MAKLLTDIAANSPAFAGELGRLRPGGTRNAPIIFDHCCTAAFSFVAAMVAQQALAQGTPRRIWVVCDALPAQERIAAELPLWGIENAVFLPEQEVHINNGISDPDLAAERLAALKALSVTQKIPQVAVLTAAALRQKAPVFSEDTHATILLNVESDFPPEELTAQLTEHGFERVEQVVARGQWSLRGGILDVFPLQSSSPLRVEFFGDSVESIRAFDVDSQLSFRKLASAELVLEEPPADRELATWITPQDWVVSLPGTGVAGDVVLFETPPDRLDLLPDEETPDLAQVDASAAETRAFFGTPLGSFETGDFVMQEARRQVARVSLLQWKREKWRVVMFFPHAGEKKRFDEICGEDEAWSAVRAQDGDLPFGFTIPGAKVAVLSAAEIFGRYSSPHARLQADREDRLRRERAQAPLREIEEGDLVIHAAHGLGRFEGIHRDEQTGEEELTLLRTPPLLPGSGGGCARAARATPPSSLTIAARQPSLLWRPWWRSKPWHRERPAASGWFVMPCPLRNALRQNCRSGALKTPSSSPSRRCISTTESATRTSQPNALLP